MKNGSAVYLKFCCNWASGFSSSYHGSPASGKRCWYSFLSTAHPPMLLLPCYLPEKLETEIGDWRPWGTEQWSLDTGMLPLAICLAGLIQSPTSSRWVWRPGRPRFFPSSGYLHPLSQSFRVARLPPSMHLDRRRTGAPTWALNKVLSNSPLLEFSRHLPTVTRKLPTVKATRST